MKHNLGALLEGASRLVVLGVGSELRSDDVAGLLVARALAEAFPNSETLLAIEGETAPENFTGQILRFAPSHLVIVDCADLGEAPGTVRAFPPEQIGGVSSNTHTLPLKIIVDYIRHYHPCSVLVVGIAPASLAFDGAVSPAVLAAAESVAGELALLASRLLETTRSLG
jgi:hydrogenase 3 maturation protease